MTDTILVIGATGTTGRRLSTRLAARGITVRAAGRQPGDGRTPFDWNRPETHGPALAGVDAVYLIPPSFVEDPTDMTGPFLGRAQQAGVSKVVALSSLGAVFPTGASSPGGASSSARSWLADWSGPFCDRLASRRTSPYRMRSAGVPDDYAAMLLRDMEGTRNGSSALVTDVVERVAGRRATRFADYAVQAASAWSRP